MQSLRCLREGNTSLNHTRTDRPGPTDEDEVAAAIELGREGMTKTELGRLVIAARREFLLAERRFLDRDELEREMAERRGVSPDHEA